MKAQHYKLLHYAKRKVQENKRQKPGVDLAARIFCFPRGTRERKRERKKENSDSFDCWQWQYPRSEGNTEWKEGSKAIRAISSHRIMSFLEIVHFICLTNCWFSTCPKRLSSQVAGKLKTHLTQCTISVFQFGKSDLHAWFVVILAWHKTSLFQQLKGSINKEVIQARRLKTHLFTSSLRSLCYTSVGGGW